MNGSLYPELPILVVDDEAYVVASVGNALKAEGINHVFGIQDPREVLDFLASRKTGVLLLDLSMPGMSGEELLRLVRRDFPETVVAIITGNREIDRAVACMREGAADYLTKPVERARLVATVRRLIENRELARENLAIKERLLGPKPDRNRAFAPLVTADPSMEAAMAYAEAIAGSSYPVLVTGETGTGKELFARAIHELSTCGGEFVPVNVAGLDDTFFSDALFGHKAGAFTGAQGSLDGLVDKAKGGSLFLDEIGDIGQASQVKLLRLIETGEYYPLGSDLMKRCKARVIVATNRDLAEESRKGIFRKDLFYRLAAHQIRLPPLRERLDDIPLLVDAFLQEALRDSALPPPPLPRGLFPLLSTYDFPGNIRELRSMVIDTMRRHPTGPLPLKTFKDAIGAEGRREPRELANLSFPSPLPSIKKTTELLVAEALRRSQGNQALAARLLGISPQAMSKRVRGRTLRKINED